MALALYVNKELLHAIYWCRNWYNKD